MRKLYSLLAWFSCSASASVLYEGDLYDSVETFDLELPAKTSTSVPYGKNLYDSVETFDLKLPDTASLSEKLSRLTISPSAKSNQNIPRALAQVSALAEEHSLKELDEALRALIDVKGITVDEASHVLALSPHLNHLTDERLYDADWKGYHYFLRCLQSKGLRNLPSFHDFYKTFDMRQLHKLFALSYKRSWGDLSSWNDHLHKMDWVKFWEVIFEVDSVELFKDLVSQKVSLPFNRLVNLRKSKLSDLVKKFKANKIRAYLNFDGKEVIIWDEDGRSSVDLLKWDEFGKCCFKMSTVISVAVRSNDLDFFKNFESTYPKLFPFVDIASEALCQARFDLFHWVYSKSPEEERQVIHLDLGVLGYDHWEERLEFLRWIFEQLPEWTPSEHNISRLLPNVLDDAYAHNSNICPKKSDLSNEPSYALLKWALKHKPGWILKNPHAILQAQEEMDLDLLFFIYGKPQGNTERPKDIDILAFENGEIDFIRDNIVSHRSHTREELLAAATNGKVKVLEWLAEEGHEVNFDREALIELANSNHIPVIRYIHEKHPKMFQNPFNIDRVLSGEYWDDGSKLEMLKCLYELFTLQNIRLSLNGLVGLMRHQCVISFDWVLKQHPMIFEDEIEKSSKSAHEKIKEMIMHAVAGKNREKVEFLKSQVRSKLDWTSSDLRHIAEHEAFYLLDELYRDRKDNEFLWNPIKYIEVPAYLQWYHFKVNKDLPWEDLAYAAACGGHRASLYWILTKSPSGIRESVEQKFHGNTRFSFSRDKKVDIIALLERRSDHVYHNINSTKDEVELYYDNQKSMEITTTLELL